jgi:hypothetical protein
VLDDVRHGSTPLPEPIAYPTQAHRSRGFRMIHKYVAKQILCDI